MQDSQNNKIPYWVWVLIPLVIILFATNAFAFVTELGQTLQDVKDVSMSNSSYGQNNGNNSGSGNGSSSGDDGNSSSSYTYSKDDIEEAFSGLESSNVYFYSVNDNSVDGAVTIKDGTYFLEGSLDAEGMFYIFEPVGGTSDDYLLSCSVAYFGHYYAQLKSNDIFIFMPGSNNKTIVPKDENTFAPQAPYTSGCYIVGEDIPSGTYTISVDESIFGDSSKSQMCAAYIMKDLLWEDDSVVETYDLEQSSTKTITLEDGDYLELYGAIANPGNSPASKLDIQSNTVSTAFERE